MAEKDPKTAEKPHEKKWGGGESKDKLPPRRPQQAPSKPMVSASGKEIRGVVRLAGRDLRGNLPIRRAITSVRGVGINLGTVISGIATQRLGMNDKTMLGELSEEEVLKLEHVLMHPESYGVPTRMLNRQNDAITGKDGHLIGPDLVFAVRQDIDHEKDSGTWRGYRHAYGQKVRGQRTRSTGRTGMTVGVLRKAVLAKAGAAAAAQTGAAAQAAGAPGAAAPAAGAKGAAAPAAKAAPGAAPAAKAPAKKEEAKK
ncbi:30S ribosomal protein S13 [uncultured archaeon]|nr:30S ribosomal protein S13 [uncultured archaeon]